MCTEEVFERLRKLLAEQLGAPMQSVTMEASLTEDLGADSLDVVALVMAVEEEFDIWIPDEAVTGVSTVADAVARIEACLPPAQ